MPESWRPRSAKRLGRGRHPARLGLPKGSRTTRPNFERFGSEGAKAGGGAEGIKERCTVNNSSPWQHIDWYPLFLCLLDIRSQVRLPNCDQAGLQLHFSSESERMLGLQRRHSASKNSRHRRLTN